MVSDLRSASFFFAACCWSQSSCCSAISVVGALAFFEVVVVVARLLDERVVRGFGVLRHVGQLAQRKQVDLAVVGESELPVAS